MSRPDRPATRAAQPALTTLEGRRLLSTMSVIRTLSPSTLVSEASPRVAASVATPHFAQIAPTGTARTVGAASPLLVNSPSAVAGSSLALSRVEAEAVGSAISSRTSTRTIVQPVAVPTFAASRVPATTTASVRLIAQPSTLTHPSVSILNLAGAVGGKSFTAREV